MNKTVQKIIFVVILAISTLINSGCGRVDRWWAGTTGKPVETCYKGINYLQFTSGATAQLDINGKPVACN